MFTRIQARRFRCLQACDQPVDRLAALVGPNASGKSTFLDVIGLLGDIVGQRADVAAVLGERSGDFRKLLWMGEGTSFELALEARLPDSVRAALGNGKRNSEGIRYEVAFGIDEDGNEVGIEHEALYLLADLTVDRIAPTDLFPRESLAATSILTQRKPQGWEPLLRKNTRGNDNFYAHGSKKFNPSFRLGRSKSALANLPEDEESFPAAIWFRGVLERSVQALTLSSLALRRPSPPGLGLRFKTDGSNLPWVVARARTNSTLFQAWLAHVRTALEDVVDIDTVERPEDKHRYLVVKYRNGAEVPSWLLSDGTLRLLALTLPAYLRDMDGVYLIEEPENGIHPRAIETVIQSLSSLYSGQVLLATHSPIAVNIVDPAHILCFAKNKDGATDIVAGDRHPALREWKRGAPDLGTLFAAGVLS
ncbi:MAG: methylation-associated defense system AAA family ATPase MAD3 [Betaproteobacteria bacterium]